MKTKQSAKVWCLCLIALNVLFIWGNSLLPREVSSAFSRLVGTVLNWFFSGGGDAAEGEGQGILRKIAHFTEFFTLGMLLCWLTMLMKAKKWICWLLPLGVGLTVACIDETIQIFVPGRGPGLRDVAIDTAGVALGICIVMLWLFILTKRKSRKR